MNAFLHQKRSLSTGFSSGICLQPLDLAHFGNGQVEIACGDNYSVGNMREISIVDGKLVVVMSEVISGCGHPPAGWENHDGGEFIATLADYLFAYIGPGGNGSGNRILVQSARYCTGGGYCSVVLFPPDGKLIDPLTVGNLEAAQHTGSFTIMPQAGSGSSIWRHKPWLTKNANHRVFRLLG